MDGGKRFVIGSKIGSGSYASVYRATLVESDGSRTSLACKVFDKSRAPRDVVSKFLPRELALLAAVRDDRLVHLSKVLVADRKVYMFMTYANAGDLHRHIVRNGPLSERGARSLFADVFAGLRYLHAHDIAHRDLKCENILLDAPNGNEGGEYRAIIGDFGFARRCPQGDLSETFCGTATYAAPEIIAGVPYDPKLADVWSLGVLLYVMLCARMPYKDAAPSTMLDRMLRREMRRSSAYEKLTTAARSLVVAILDPHPVTRIGLVEVAAHEWTQQQQQLPPRSICT